MDNNITKKIFEVIIANLKSKTDNISVDTELSSIGIDSLTFIKLVVALECEFDFEFDDEKLVIKEFQTIKSLINYTEKKVTTIDTGY